MVNQKIIINNPSGLHLRPAGNLCNEAMKYQSAITFEFEETSCGNNVESDNVPVHGGRSKCCQ